MTAESYMDRMADEAGEERARIGEIVYALGQTAEARDDLTSALCKAYGAHRESDLRDQVKQWMGLHEEYDLEFEGFRADLGPPPKSLVLEANVQLTPDILAWAFEHHLLKLDPSTWRAIEKSESRELHVLRQCVREQEGSPRLTIRRVE